MSKWACLCLAAALLAAGGEAYAHKMMAASRVRDDGTVLLQAFFPDGTPARGVRTEVRRPDGALFLTGQTDEAGRLTVTPEGLAGRWTATFTGSMGHKTETRFVVGGPGPEQPAAAAPATEDSAPQPALRETAPRTQPAPEGAPTEDLIREQPFPVAEVLAGLGLIFGLSAVLMCLKLRRDIRQLKDSDEGTTSSATEGK
ncbi:MAG: hypothetical protein KAX44_08055 [Candidatus Brocadiae bacterium]|nr:hypothetical protein [Candidatus Brocadiia bacterium]